MSISSLRGRAASALIALGAAAAAVLALAVPAGASTGSRYYSAEQVGYAATGAQFQVVRATVYLPKPTRYASAVGQYSHSVQLWSSGLVGIVGVSANTSGSDYTPYAKVFDASSHQLLASNPDGGWCGSTCVPAMGTFPAGDTVVLRLTYFPKTGYLNFLADDHAHHLHADYTTALGVSFTQARVGTEFGSDPWTAPPSFTHPAAWTKIAAYRAAMVQTYSGKFSTLASWFVHQKVFMASTTGSLIDVEAAPTDLTNGGSSFQEWLAPAGVNGPAQPPQG
jgi:hypothetical protein